MKNTIIKYGLISGVISAVLMLISTLTIKNIGYDKVGMDNAALIGYTLIILAMSIIFMGIKSFRDEVNQGSVGFTKALLIGLGITVISCVCYSLMWLVVYYNFMPNFMDDYANYYIEKLKSSGATESDINQAMTEMQSIRGMYQNPLSIFAITLTEPLPVGVIVSFIAAFILKRKG